MKKINYLTIFAMSLSFCLSAQAKNLSAGLSYDNTDFNQKSPGWADTLTIYNTSSQDITITQLQFETNYNTLDTSQLYGTISHPLQSVVPQQIGPYDYLYTMSTQSPYSQQYTTIPANGSVNLTQIPLAHDQISVNGTPLYYRPPFHVRVTLANGTQLNLALKNQCSGQQCNDPATGKIVGAYFTNWANYRYAQNQQNALMPNQLPIANMNTVYYDVGKINNTTADVSFTDINHDQYYVPAFDALKQQYPYINLIYSFGGWGDAGSNSYPSYDLAAIFDTQNPALIQKLADNLVNTVISLGFNGIDIDYEWSAIQPGTNENMQLTTARALGFQTLLQDIHQDFVNITAKNPAQHYLLTSAVFAGVDSIADFANKGGDWKKVAAALDYFNVMTYDMHGQFDTSQTPPDNITGFLSAMQTEHHYTNEVLNHFNVSDAINAYLSYGVPNNKLVLGLPVYTRIEKSSLIVNDVNKGLFLTLANDQPAGELGGGTTDYKCIVNNDYCWGGFSFDRSQLVYVPTNFSGSGLGALAKTPWAYQKNFNWLMTFDDGDSAKYKGNWAYQNGLAGVMLWEIDGDVPNTDSHYSAISILYNAWSGLTQHSKKHK